MLGVLAIDGVLSAIAGALLLQERIGSVPFPVSALISGLVNIALVWAASYWTTRPRIAALPLWTWFATVLVLMLGGPGDDVVLGGAGVMQMAPLIFLVLGAGPPAWLLSRRR